jgi:hypothetical protein
MSSHFRTIVVASVALVALSAEARAGSHSRLGTTPPGRPAQPDSRWDPWLGCWGVDPDAARQQSAPGVTCIVPVAGSHAVEALTIARGKIVARDRLDTSGEPHSVSGQGCRGFETVEWSATGRRALLRSDFVCGTSKAASSTIYAILPGGDWLRVEQVRSGGGVSVSLERRRPVALLSEVSAEAARVIEDRRLAIITARAVAAAPITTDEIIETVHIVDPGVVRSWIIASEQTFDLDGAALATLISADVPQSVIQAMMPAGAAMAAPALARVYGGYGGPTAYANATVAPQEMEQPYGCPSIGPMGCNVVANPYSILNGYGVYPYGYPGFSPFTSVFPGGFLVNRVNNNARLVGVQRRPVVVNVNVNNKGHRPNGQPVGKPGIVVGGGRRR